MTESDCLYLKHCDGCEKSLGWVEDPAFDMYCTKCRLKYHREHPYPLDIPMTDKEFKAQRKSIAESRRVMRLLVRKCGEDYRRKEKEKAKRKRHRLNKLKSAIS